MDAFYSVMAGTCFALVGLWWSVVDRRKEWTKDTAMRSLAGGVYLSFLIPGVMSLAAQIGGENKLVWRSVFVLAALIGIFTVTRLLLRTRTAKSPGLFRRFWWVSILLYLLIGVFGAAPELAKPLGLQPLQVEGFLLALLVLIGHGLAWDFLTEPAA